MTEQLMKQIKKVLKKENVKVEATYYDRTNDELRIKVIDIITHSNFEGAMITPPPMNIRNKMTIENIAKVLNALSKNGLRPRYRTEQRENHNNYGTYDSRYVIFK